MKRLYMLGYCKEELIKKPKTRKKEYPNIPKGDIKRLLTHIKNDRPDYYYPLCFIARTGRRITETTLIKKEDVEFKEFKPVRINIRAETTKSKEKAPLISLDGDLKGLVRQAYNTSKSKYLFSNKCGRRCIPDQIRKYLKNIAIRHLELEIGPKITPHYFRHRFFTECGKANVSLADVKAVSGIKDIKVLLEYYSHSTVEGQDKVLAITTL